MQDNMEDRPQLPASVGRVLAGSVAAALVADLAQPALPLAGLLLAGSLLALAVLPVWGVLSVKPAPWRRTALLAAGVMVALSALVIIAQGRTQTRLEHGVLGAEIGLVRSAQVALLGRPASPADADAPQPARAPSRVLAAMSVDDAEMDPRRALAELGLDWGMQSFRTAIDTADARAVRLYLMGGLRLNGPVARAYVDPHYSFDDTFDPTIAALLTELDGVDATSFCLSDRESWTHLVAHRRDLPHAGARLAFVRHFCGRSEILDRLTDRLRTANAALARQSAANETRPLRVRACEEAFTETLGVGQTFQAAAGFSLFEVTTLEPPGDTVLAELNAWLLAGANGDPVEAYNAAITRGCETAQPMLAIDTRQRDTVADVLRLLMGEPVSGPVPPDPSDPGTEAP